MASDYSYLSNSDGKYIDSMYEKYLEDPDSVDFGWKKFFEGFDFARKNYGSSDTPEEVLKEINVLNLIHGYRKRGHLFTKTNPVRPRREYSPTLDLEVFGLSEQDLDTVFQAGAEVGLGPAKLRDIVDLLSQTYCSSIGVEYMSSRDMDMVKWLREKMESSRNTPQYSIEEKKRILKKLNEAVAFENFLGSKYVGQKRFSLEGGETLIPAIDAVIEKGAELGIEEFVVGMAHRGRLNVLVNTLRKTYDDVFSEFEQQITDNGIFDGDVKYHVGHSTDVKTKDGNKVHLSLCPNPSHLESVAPVAIGKARAKIDIKFNRDHKKVAPVIIHGDASVAGQGVVYEVIQMSELEPYEVGGSIHIVINNQVGFTTNYLEARSSTYCTDIAKVTQSPVFHVNGDDAEAVVFATQLAMEFRQKFHKDVFIDLLCYRRHGHNEGDEPRFTQPELYKIIEKHKNPREIYFEKLRSHGSVEADLAKKMEQEFKDLLEARLNEVKEKKLSVSYSMEHSGWKNHRLPEAKDWEKSPETGVSEKILKPLAKKISDLPDEMVFYRKARKIFNSREQMVDESGEYDWAMGELMAYASLLKEGFNVRMSGQDSERGTFAHRHSTLLAENDGNYEEFIPLQHLNGKQGNYEVYNSLLSEYAVLGFEYGYSWSAPQTLVMWEAQFGDFVNGAQIIIDQYISSALTKWQRLSGLVMLLPHGFEGQGPEHSSARLERFLELCAGHNMQVANPTTPAQMFHLLRRQMKRPFKVPLIVMTPKSLLRLPAARSKFDEFTSGRFQEVIDDSSISSATKVKKVVFCSGKVYYDLASRQEEENRGDVALVRVEQLHPLPEKQLKGIVSKYKNAEEWVWCQEEPENMGAWPFILRKFREVNLSVVSRKENSSPATGYKKQHDSQQKYIIDTIFNGAKKSGSKKKSKKELVKK